MSGKIRKDEMEQKEKEKEELESGNEGWLWI